MSMKPCAPFLKKPDFLLVDGEDIAERQHQLQEYLNSILQCHAYRNMPETVSECSFILLYCCILYIAYLFSGMFVSIDLLRGHINHILPNFLCLPFSHVDRF